MHRKIVCAVAFMVGTLSVAADAKTASPEKLRAAYDIALKCFIADGYAAGNRAAAHDDERDKYFMLKADEAAKAGEKVAQALGYQPRRFIDDAMELKDTEIPKYRTDPSYFSQLAATCKAYGLM